MYTVSRFLLDKSGSSGPAKCSCFQKSLSSHPPIKQLNQSQYIKKVSITSDELVERSPPLCLSIFSKSGKGITNAMAEKQL